LGFNEVLRLEKYFTKVKTICCSIPAPTAKILHPEIYYLYHLVCMPKALMKIHSEYTGSILSIENNTSDNDPK